MRTKRLAATAENPRRPSARKPIAFATLGLFLALFLFPGPAGQADDQEEVVQSASAPLPIRTDVSFNDEEYYDDALELPDGSRIDALARTVFDSRYGDAWIDRTVSPSVWRIAVVDATSSEIERFNALTGGNARIAVVARTYSIDQLESYQETIFNILRVREGARWSVGADPRVGKVVVETTPLDPTLSSEIEAAGVPTDAFTVALGGGFTLTHNARWDYPPYEGGLGVTFFPEECLECWRTHCTSAFTMVDGGIYKGTSAGHCAHNWTADEAWMDAPPERISTTGTNSYWENYPTDSDAVRFYIPPSQKTNRIFTNVGHRVVDSPRYYAGDLKLGVRLCFQGLASDNSNCGEINKRDFQESDNIDQIHNHLWRISWPSLPGDSGGPVYGIWSDGDARPAGIVSGGEPEGMIFHAIGYVIQDLGGDIYWG